MADDLDAILGWASAAVRAAGAVLAPRVGDAGPVREKASGPVTELDTRA